MRQGAPMTACRRLLSDQCVHVCVMCTFTCAHTFASLHLQDCATAYVCALVRVHLCACMDGSFCGACVGAPQCLSYSLLSLCAEFTGVGALGQVDSRMSYIIVLGVAVRTRSIG